jgi:hypothetical protein
VVVTPPPPVTKLLHVTVNLKRHMVTFELGASGTSTGFQCALVRKPTRKGAKTPKPQFTKCGATKTYRNLKKGSYVFYARAVGPGGIPKPIVARFSLH